MYVPGMVSMAIQMNGGPKAFLGGQYQVKQSIRKPAPEISKETLDSWIKNGTIDQDTHRHLKEVMSMKKNIRRRRALEMMLYKKEFSNQHCVKRAERNAEEESIPWEGGDAFEEQEISRLIDFKIVDYVERLYEIIPEHLQVIIGLTTGLSGAAIFLWIFFKIFPLKMSAANFSHSADSITNII